jgi:uncharacterized protein
MMGTSSQSPFLVEVTADRLSATISVSSQAPAATLTLDAVLAALQTAHLVVNDDVRGRAEAFVAALQTSAADRLSEATIAVGRPPVESRDGVLLWDAALRELMRQWNDDGAPDFYDPAAVLSVAAGTVLGRIGPPTPGTDGVDVHGAVLPARGQSRPLVLKDGVQLGDDGASVVATTAGKVRYQSPELAIGAVQELAGDADPVGGVLEVPGDAVIRGTIPTACKVRAGGELTVWGSIEAADVAAGGQVNVRGGILARGKGRVVAGGQIAAKFCDEADLQAQGDIRLRKEMMNSRVHTESRLLLPQGAIIGGEVFARCGIEVATLGSEGGIATTVAVGVHPDEFRAIEETARGNDKKRAAVEKIRQSVGPLMAQLKRLTNVQREKATELMYQADSIEAEIRKSEERAAALLAGGAPDCQPYVLVSAGIHPRVSLSIGDRIMVFAEPVKGPVRIERRKIKNYTAMTSTNTLTGLVRELPARKLELAPAKAGAVPAGAGAR